MIWVLDNAQIVGAVSYYTSIIWAVQFQGLSEFELVLPCTAENLDLLKAGRVLCRSEDRDGGTFKNCMIIRKVSFMYDADSGYMLTVTGKGLKDIVSQRVIWTQDSGEEVAVEDMVANVVEDNCCTGAGATRDITLLSVGSFAGVCEELATFQVFGQNVGEWLCATAQEYGFGWDVYITAGGYVFMLYAGTDRTRGQQAVPPVVFSANMDNLLSCEYVLNFETFKNAAIIGGEGEGTDKRTARIGTATNTERFEAYVDGSSVSSNGEIITEETYLEMLKQYGETELAAYDKEKTFTADVDFHAPYEIGVDYNLGDIVEVDAGFGITATARITEVLFNEDVNGKVQQATFEEWEV